MLPLPIISNTSRIIDVDELAKLKQEIIAANMYLHDGSAARLNIIPYNTNPYCSMNGVSFTNVSQFNGSPYGHQVPSDSAINAVFIHCFPTKEIYDQYLDDPTLPSFVRLANYNSYGQYPSITRNGLTSVAYFPVYAGYEFDLFVYYDKSTGYAMQYNPRIISSPVRYYF